MNDLISNNIDVNNNNVNGNCNINIGRKKDKIHAYFTVKIDDGESKLHCNIKNCERTFSIKTSTSNLKLHISNEHKDEWNLYEENKKNTKFEKKTIIDNSTDPNEQNESSLMAIAFAKNSLPYTLIENEFFMNALISVKNSKNLENLKITKNKMRDLILNEGNKICEKIINKLAISKQPVTMAIDGWTNVRSNKVTNILLISCGDVYYYSSIENYNSQNTVDWLVSKLQQKLENLYLKNVNVIGITTDNENLMVAVRKNLQKIFPILIDLPCSAHIIQLCLKEICTIELISELIKNINDIVYMVKTIKLYSTKLYDLQLKDNIKIPLTVIRPADTRWSSLILCIERLITLKKYIKNIEPKYDDIFWNKMISLYTFIEPFKEYTNEIQKDDATLYTVWLIFKKLEIHFKSDNIPNEYKLISNEIIDLFEYKWNKHININIINISRLFSFDYSAEINVNSINFIETWGSQYVTIFNLVPNLNINNAKNILSLQLAEFLSKQNQFSYIDNYVATFKQTCINNPSTLYSPKYIWGKYIFSHTILAKVAIAILSLCPSEACVERSFSMQTDVHSLDRNRLSNNSVEAEMHVKWNYSKI